MTAPGRPVFDVVLLWKQNDGGLYGRRADMLAKYLARSPRVGRVVHFDAPIGLDGLVGALRTPVRARTSQDLRVLATTLRRAAGLERRSPVRRHVLVHRGHARPWAELPVRGPDAATAFVRRRLERAGVGADGRPTVFVVYPVGHRIPEVLDGLRPDVVVADVVDDNREWLPDGSPIRERWTKNYAEVLARADVVVANNEHLADRMAQFADRVRIVPNGLERPAELRPGRTSRALRRLARPVVGYAGNLSSRVDLDLLDELARRRPTWSFAFVGHTGPDALRLDRLPNVHFLGVESHRVALASIATFDAGIIPHVDGGMTRAMNPLKAYVYRSLGVPVVATRIANLAPLDGIVVADGVDGFERAVAEAIEGGHRPLPDTEVEQHCWERRVELLVDLIDEQLG